MVTVSKFLLLNDIHLADRSPASRTDDWTETLFGKLDQVSRLAHAQKVDGVLIAGDFFHRRQVSFSLLHRLMRWCKSFPFRVYGIPGNHDLQHDRYESLDQQALGILFSSGAVINVSESSESLWVGSKISVEIAGVPWPRSQCLSEYPRPKRDGAPGILMTHCFLAPESGEIFGDPVLGHRELSELGWSVIHAGHCHYDHGVTRVGDTHFVDVGSIGRGALAEDQVTRQPKVVLVEFSAENKTLVTQVALNVAPPETVFNIEAHEQRSEEKQQIAEFVENLSGQLAGMSSGNTVETHLQGLDIPDEVRTRVQSYLEAAEGG